MRERVRDDVDGIVEEYGLHRGLDPVVDLSPLGDRFPVRFADMSAIGLRGLILPPRHGWPAHEENPARVVIDETFEHWQEAGSRDELRLIYAHEVGHGIAHHAGPLVVEHNGLGVQREEWEAWKIAARLLIPCWAVNAIENVEMLAQVCRVPLWIATLRTGRTWEPTKLREFW